MAKLLSRLDKRLDAAEVTGVQMDYRLPGRRANGSKETFNPVGEGARLFGDGAAGTLAGKCQDSVVDALAQRAAVDFRHVAKPAGGGLKSLNGTLKLRRGLGTAGGATFFKPLCMAVLKAAFAAFFKPGFTPGLEINLGIALRRRLFPTGFTIGLSRRCLSSIIQGRLLTLASGMNITIASSGSGFRSLGRRTTRGSLTL